MDAALLAFGDDPGALIDADDPKLPHEARERERIADFSVGDDWAARLTRFSDAGCEPTRPSCVGGMGRNILLPVRWGSFRDLCAGL